MKKQNLFKNIWLLGVMIYALIVLFVTMWPTPVDQGLSQPIKELLETMHRLGVPKFFGYDQLEFTANIAMFVPLGVFAQALVSQKSWPFTLGLLVSASLLIELTQLLFLPGRYAMWQDVLANSIGALVGISLVLGWRAIAHKRSFKIV